MIDINSVVDGWVNYLPRSIDDRYYGGYYDEDPYPKVRLFVNEFVGVRFIKHLRTLALEDERMYSQNLQIGIVDYHYGLDVRDRSVCHDLLNQVIVVAMHEYLFCLVTRMPSIAKLVRSLESSKFNSLKTEYVYFKLSMQLVKDINKHKRDKHNAFTSNLAEYQKRFDAFKK